MKMKFERPIVALDIESTGVDPEKDRIIELALIKIDPNKEGWAMDSNVIRISTRINPTIPIPESSSKIHGILDSDVADKPKFCDIAEKTFKFLQGSDLLGFNSNRFDVPILYNELQRCGFTLDYRSINLLDVGNLFKIKEERTLGAAVKFYLNRDHEDAHGASADVAATYDVFFSQLDKYRDLPESTSELAKMMNYDRPVLDLSGKFSTDEEGRYIYNFGKNKGLLVESDMSFLGWMLDKANFSRDTWEIGTMIRNKILGIEE